MSNILIDPIKWKLYESSLIKSIRRCLVEDAIYWGVVLYNLDRAEGVWRRLFIHLSEDIGIADRNLPSTIEALYNNYNRLKINKTNVTAYEGDSAERLPYVHAIMLLATANKSRAVDNAITVNFECPDNKPPPDYAIDFHSPLGRRLGRGILHFLDEAAYINNEFSGDLWKDKARKHLIETRGV